ncbi:MAG: hypothetical protein M3R17_12005 [Bacteroidota bacterium]|nr:hypothetical protein [Bacteroidota bacterium]
MNLNDERMLSVENYKKCGLAELERLCSKKIFPGLNKMLETTSELLESIPDDHRNPEEHAALTKHVHELLELCKDHNAKEIMLINSFRTGKKQKNSSKASEVIPKLVNDHRRLQNLFQRLEQLSDQYGNNSKQTSLHRLVYARINNARQDMARMFFLEEEYLFPRLTGML